MTESERVVLPTNVRPIRYDITLNPDLSDFTFQGRETIEIEVVDPTDTVTLNSIEITVRSGRLVLEDGTALSPVEVAFDEERGTVSFSFGRSLPPGPARFEIEFAGELNDKLRGFYRSRYLDVDGRERYLATTQMQATDARRAFPCWDEPALKAVFELTLLVPEEMTAVSNMPVEEETPAGPGKKKVRFGPTPVMSTYILGFVVGDLASVEQTAADGTLIRVWATRGREEQGRFALEISVRLLAYFNEYFDIPYPLSKLDHLAIPDFAAGAMENWGAITYRETALLVDPENSSAGTRQIVAAIVAHEMAHMWFGDLVTMAWWDDVWLNESFASWMGDKAVDHLHPEWEMWTQFLTADTNRALSLDGLRSSHPIEQEVNNPAEIGQLFDAISYSKGASILRMLEDFLGEEVFRLGIRRYLVAHRYGNATTEDLWNALGEESGRPVATMMDTWVKQLGYPVLDVRVSREAEAIEVALTQSRFVYDEVEGSGSADDMLWHAPVGVRTASDAEPVAMLMEGPEATVQVKPASYGSVDEWIKVNPLQTGFYRVSYQEDELARLKEPIQNRVLPPADRLGIQNDAYALARAGRNPATRFLAVAEAYRNETDASVCADLATNLAGIDALLWDEPFYPAFQAFAREVFRPIGEGVGWDARAGEGHLDALLRSVVLSQLGRYGDEETLREAAARFATYAEDPAGVNPDIRRALFRLAAATGDRSTYDTIWELQQRTPLQEEKIRLLVALGDFQRSDLLALTLDRALSDDVRVHDTISLVASVASNRLGRDMAWEFVKDNWDEFDRRYGEGGFAIMRLVSVISAFTTEERRAEVERFFKDNPAPAAERTVSQSLERIAVNAAWLERNRRDLADWFVA